MAVIKYLAADEKPDQIPYTWIICTTTVEGSIRHGSGITHRLPPEALQSRLPDFVRQADERRHSTIYITGAPDAPRP